MGMGRLCLSSTAALISLIAIPALYRPTAALTSAEAIDSVNAHPNVGAIMAPHNISARPTERAYNCGNGGSWRQT